MNLLASLFHRARSAAEVAENAWFDRTRNVSTAGEEWQQNFQVPQHLLRDSEAYVPARPANIRAALRHTGVRDYSSYTFIDMGSGKGRAMFVAAEFRFRKIIGVEFSPPLHDAAIHNIGSFRPVRHRRRFSRNMQAVHANARDYSFPHSDLVLFFFNPFGEDTMRHVMANLAKALQDRPRRVSVILLWPRLGQQVLELPGMRLKKDTRRYQIFELD